MKIEEGGRRELFHTQRYSREIFADYIPIVDAEHTVYKCARWQSYRFVLTSIIRTVTAANIVRERNRNLEERNSGEP